MRRTQLLVVPALALACTALLAPSSSAAGPSSTPSFGVPRVVDPIHVYGEPNLEVNPKTGAIHATGATEAGYKYFCSGSAPSAGFEVITNGRFSGDRRGLTRQRFVERN